MRRFLFLCGLLVTSQCTAQCIAPAQWRDGLSGQILQSAQVIDRALAVDVVLLGERHDSAAHHRWQLDTLRALHARKPDLALGMEMFPRRAQPLLDRWVAGELSEEQFLAAVGWREIWNMDPQLYLPLLHFARDERIPLRALNVDAALIRAVAAQGFDAVPEAQREGLTPPAAADALYLARLREAYAKHGRGTDEAAFQRFVAAQQVWDRAMAQAIAVRRPMVAIMGSGHLLDRRGVPDQLRDLGVPDVLVLLPLDLEDCEDYRPGMADALYGADEN